MRKVFALVFAVLMTVVTVGCESKATSRPAGCGAPTGGAGAPTGS
jgi:hypothetical protein